MNCTNNNVTLIDLVYLICCIVEISAQSVSQPSVCCGPENANEI